MTKQGIGQFVTQLTRDGYLVSESDPLDRRVPRRLAELASAMTATHRLALVLQGLEEEWARHVGKQRYRAFRVLLDEIADVNTPQSALDPQPETP